MNIIDSTCLFKADCLPTFSGTTDVNAFIDDFSGKVALLTEDENAQTKFLKFSLKDEVWSQYLLNQDSLKTAQDIKEWLKLKFGDTRRAPIALGKLLKLEQKNNESLGNFSTRLLTGWKDHFGSTWAIKDPNAEKLLLALHFSNVKPALRKKIPEEFNPKTVDAFMIKMRRLEGEMTESLDTPSAIVQTPLNPVPRPHMQPASSNYVARNRHQNANSPRSHPYPHSPRGGGGQPAAHGDKNCTCYHQHTPRNRGCPKNSIWRQTAQPP